MHSNNTSLSNKITLLLSTVFFSILLSACGNSEDAEKVKEALEVNQLDITTLQLTSPNTVIEFNAKEQFTAQAIIGDGSGSPLPVNDKVTWSVSDSSAASITSTGLLTGKDVGMVTVTIEFADLSVTKDIELSDAQLESINIANSPSPVSVCQSGYQLTAMGTYDDTRVSDITSSVTWSSNDATSLSIDDTGAFSTYKDGSVTVTASKDSIEQTASITINKDLGSLAISASSDTVYIGRTLSFTATGTYDNASTADISDNVSWASDTTSALTISNDEGTKGVATGVSEDMANVTATCLSSPNVTSNSVLITVEEEPVIDSIAIEEDASILEFILANSPEELTANLKRSADNSYSTDVTDSEYLTWSVESGTGFTISETGVLTFTQAGNAKIKVYYYDSVEKVGPFEDLINIAILAN